MHKLFIALVVAVFAQGRDAAADKTAVMVAVRQFVDGFNKGNTKTALAACADQASIIDEFPPHEWHGAGACMRNGKPVQEVGSMFTFALQKSVAGWRITGWAWAKN
jgi:hypothetical protein